MQVELAKMSNCLDGANVRERRKAKRRPEFITAKEPGLRQPKKVQIWILKGASDKVGREKVEKSSGDSSATEPRKVGNDTKPRKTQQIKKRQVCQAGWQEH